jgi:glutathione S-transferase
MAASFTIYGSPGSTATNTVRLMLADANIDYEFVTLDFMKAEHKVNCHLDLSQKGAL